MRFHNCLGIVNTIAGNRKGRDVFAATLERLWDEQGITHEIVTVPHCKDLRPYFRCGPEGSGGKFDCVAICGGDGTVSSVIHAALATPEADRIIPPLLTVPCRGSSNSVARALGLARLEDAMPFFELSASGCECGPSTVPVPVFRVLRNGVLLRYMVSHIATGVFPAAIRATRAAENFAQEVVWFPKVLSSFTVCALYASVKKDTQNNAWCAWREEHNKWEPCKTLVASQVRWIRPDVSLTPSASRYFSSNAELSLSVTQASNEATSARLMHLLCREGRCGVLELEDGVESRVLSGLPENKPALRLRAPCSASPVELLVDGELIDVGDEGDTVEISVEPTSFHVKFMALKP